MTTTRKVVLACWLSLSTLVFRSALAVPGCDDAPLTHWSVSLGRLYPGKLAKVTVDVVDRRPWENLLAAGLLGPGSDKGKGLYYPYLSQIPHEVATFTRDAATEAIAALGLDEGPPVTLEIAIQDLQIDLYRGSGFSPMNCVGYARLETTLKDASGEVLRRGAHRLAYFEHTLPKVVMNEVAEQALSRIYQQVAWEATVRELVAQYPQVADQDALGRLQQGLENAKKSDRKGIIFWLGLAGRGVPLARKELETRFRTSKEQSLAEAAAEALGMVGATDLKDEMLALLSGSKELSNWDLDDTEMTWYLLKAVSLLGETDLSSRLPKEKMKYASTLQNLAGFVKDGTIRRPSEKEVSGLAKARRELESEMAQEREKK